MDQVRLGDASLLDRRSLLSAGLAVSAFGWSQANAATPDLEVDSLSIHVLVDSATFGPFLPDRALPGLKVIQPKVDAGKPVMSARALTGEFGLSLLATSRRGQDAVSVLIDFGYSAETVRNNLALLGIDPGSIDAAVLSHGHLDHYGGFPGFFGEAIGRKIPLYVGGEEAFCERVAMIGDPPPLMGTLDRAAVLRAGFDARIAAAPVVIGGQARTTGIIPLRSFERAAIPTQMRPGKCKFASNNDPLRGGFRVQ